MLRPSPVLTPPPASASPTTFRYAPARSPPSLSPRPKTLAGAAASPSRSRSAAVAASPRVRGPAATMAATAGDSSNNAAPKQQIPTALENNATAAAPAGDRQHPAPPAQLSTTANGNVVTDTSPSKRRGDEIDKATADRPETDHDDAAQSAKRARPDEVPPKMLPQKYEDCAVEDVVELIAHMLNELIATNDAIRTTSGGLTRFHSRAAPGISVRDYLHRLAKHATLIPPLLLSMVYYIDRLCALYPEFTINTLTVHRFLITAATVAAKGLSDSFWNNTTYARVGGVRLAELKMLELEFLYRVDWKIVPNPEVLVAYYRGLVERTPGYVLEDEGDDMDDVLDDDDDDDDDGDDDV